jgi:hypothetical protein
MSSKDISRAEANEHAKSVNAGRWPKGKTGNPAGRPPCSRNKSTLFFENLLNGQAEELIAKTIELALKGDTTALRLCLERICPPRKERTIELTMPEIREPKLLTAAIPAILTAVAEGRVTPVEAETLTRIVETGIRVIEVEELSRRVAELEKVLTTQPVEALERPTLDGISHDYASQNSPPGPGEASSADEQSHNGNGNETDAGQQPAQSRSTPPRNFPTAEPRGSNL